jgi:hypothetical protein
MADIVIRWKTDPSRRELVNHLWEVRSKHPEWLWGRESQSFPVSLQVEDVERQFLLTMVSRKTAKLVAAIPVGDPFKIEVFDRDVVYMFCDLIEDFDLRSLVLIEVEN